MRYAAAEAVSLGLSLRLVHALLDPVMYAQLALPRPVAEPAIEARRLVDEARVVLHREYDGLEVQATIAARPAGALLVGEARSAALVVVGRRGRGGPVGHLDVGGLHLGSVSAHVATHARGSVVVAGTDPLRVQGPVVVGVDAAAPAVAAIAFAFQTAQRRGTGLRACYVWTARHTWLSSGPMAPTGSDFLEDETESRRMLSEALAGWRAAYPDVPVALDVVHGMDPAARLLDAAAAASLAVVGCRERTGLRQLILGSVGQALIRSARCPVAVVHAAGGLAGPTHLELGTRQRHRFGSTT